MAPQIEFRQITQRFATREKTMVACRNIDLAVEKGEFVAIVGPSGCGKSTLLNLAAGLLKPSSGSVRFGGRPVDGPNTHVGYLTQRDTLFPWRTIEDNVSIALEIRGVSRAERQERARTLLATVGLTGFERSYPHQLSGGMRRRAILARTLIYEPEAMMMDEPFGALDSHLRMVMHEEVLRVWAMTGSTVLFVTHDLGEAITLADRVVVFSARPGTIAAIESIDLPRPRDVYRIRFDKRFTELYEHIWSHLEHSVRASTGAVA